MCSANLAVLEQQRSKLGEAAAAFERGPNGPYFVQTLASYPEGLAQRVLDDLSAAVASCGEVTIRDEEGTRSVWRLTGLPFPSLGDQTIALREYFPPNDVEAVIVYIRRGNRVTVLLNIAIGSRVDLAQAERFARLADQRLARLGGQ